MSLLHWLSKKITTEVPTPAVCTTDPHVLAQVVLAAVKTTVRGYSRVNPGISLADLDAEEREIARLRAWAMTLTDRRIRNEYFRWLEYFKKGLIEARKQLLSPDLGREKQHREWQENNDKLWAAVHECQVSGSVPTPPEA